MTKKQNIRHKCIQIRVAKIIWAVRAQRGAGAWQCIVRQVFRRGGGRSSRRSWDRLARHAGELAQPPYHPPRSSRRRWNLKTPSRRGLNILNSPAYVLKRDARPSTHDGEIGGLGPVARGWCRGGVERELISFLLVQSLLHSK